MKFCPSILLSAVCFCGSTLSGDWKDTESVAQNVKQGTILDLSESGKIPFEKGRLPKLTVNAKGKLASAEHPETEIRLMGFNFTFYPENPQVYPPMTKPEIREFAAAVRARGYNAVRIFGIDRIFNAKTMRADPEKLDYFDFLTAELGNRGIYLYLPIATYQNFLPKGKNHHNDRKMKMYLGDAETRNAWKQGAEFLLNHRNVYNGLTCRENPAVAVIEFYNELEGGLIWGKVSASTMAETEARFRRWSGRTEPIPSKLLGNVTGSPVHSEFLRFCGVLARECFDWCEKTIRATGYSGLTAQFDVPHWLDNCAVRYEKSTVAISHKYFAHPYQKNGQMFAPGESCIEKFGEYWMISNATHFADRPHFVTEYNIPRWNRYQYEAGPLFGGYSALQGTSALFIHSNAVAVAPKKGKYPYGFFNVSANPVLIGGEFLANCLYLRGDLKKASRRIDLKIRREDLQSFQSVSLEQMKLGLVTGFALAFPGFPKPANLNEAEKADESIFMEGASVDSGFAGGWSAELKSDGETKFDLDAFLRHLKNRGILPQKNRSNPKQGFFESETGEIQLNSPAKTLRIQTPKTEIAVAPSGRFPAGETMTEATSSEPACIGAVSMDGAPLRNSRKIVIVYTTEVRNSGEKHSGDHTILLERGTVTTRMKTGEFSVTIKNSNPAPFRAYALGFDGTRRKELPLERNGENLTFRVNTAALEKPTPFFELSKE